MNERMVPAQQLSDAGEDLVRLAAAKDAEIARLSEQHEIVCSQLAAMFEQHKAARAEIATITEQRDRAMMVVEAAQLWARDIHDATDRLGASIAEVRLFNAVVGFNGLAALDAEAAAESSPSLPETPEAS